MTDIVPELLEAIKKDFEKQRVDSKKIQALLKLLEDGQATYKDAHAYAVEVGEILSKVLNVHITAETLPDGKMYFNIADRVLNETLKNNYSLVSDYTEGVQARLNRQVGLKLRAQRPDFDQDRVKGFVNKLSSADDFTDVQWVLGDPMVNFTQSVVDEAIKKNAKFHSDAGMKAVIKRQVKGKACDWCRGLEGTYDYPKGTPNEVFHRHENCRCVTEYYPEKKKARQDVWSKQWRKTSIHDILKEEKRRDTLPLEDIQLPKSLSAKARDVYVKKYYGVKRNPLDLEETYKIRPGSTITNVEVIAGKGVRAPIRDIARLVRENPGSIKRNWQKVKGWAFLQDLEGNDIGEFEVHWYQCENVGKIEFKLKEW
ncbi:hypothetical protein [Ligilactobacillus saerimneri]|uniref:hypothetical protein n=1 Tax=Ligilactobacillus saerimneri TaxID=228229 RepID=UPI0004134122|nr:hypothetical protein [Ligilactobacillus saerimneri]KRL71708.1 hypothetical protein FC54_GL001403 [Ligilactobacillus saerimneri DSM 16049]